MTIMQHCPFCGSGMVYSLMDTLRCKRCKGIWKAGDEVFPAGSPLAPDRMIRKRTEPLDARLEKILDAYLARNGGRFSFDTLRWQAGDVSVELFRKYVRRCVTDRVLAEEKDRHGRIWYRWTCNKDPKRRFTGV
jgi:ribosomal protein S27AE